MRIKPFFTFSVSVALVAGMSFLVSTMPIGMPKDFDADSFKGKSAKSEAEEQASIEGAIRSIYSMRLNEKTGTIEPEWVEQAISDMDAMRLTRRVNKPLKWESMGPDNVGGRTRTLLIHRDSNNLWFTGGVSGGLFRSFTSGQSWNPVNDQQENLNVNCIAQTANGNIYYGTGEGGFVNLSGTRNGSPAFLGGGLFRSTDSRGTKFTKMANTTAASFYQCNAMVAHPSDDKFYVATEDGIYEFTNSGTVSRKLTPGSIKDLTIDKNGVLWASNNSGTVLKMNAVGAMVITNTGISTGGRTSISVSPENPNYVYIMGASSSGSFGGLFRTTDGGTAWTKLVNYSSVTDIFGSNRQGWFDNVISVDPLNKDKVYLGGVDLATWDIVNGYVEIAGTFNAPWNSNYVHADKHVITWNTATTPPTIIVGSDGGLFRRQGQNNAWTPISRGLTTLQLYNVAANELGHILGGSQDNGTQLLNYSGNSFGGQPSKTAIQVYGGDGFDVEFSRFDPKTMFVCIYYGTVARSANGGQSSSTFFDDRQPGTVQTDFNTTFCLYESAPKKGRLYLAKNAEVWVANNPCDFSETVSWYLVAKNLGNDRIIEMDYTPEGDHLFICKSGRLFRLDSLNKATYTLAANPIVMNVPAPIVQKNITPAAASGRTITSVNVDQSNAQHVVITLGGYGNTTYVYETFNGLTDVPIWKNITGNLPSMPVYDAVVDVDNNKRIILGTDYGIWYTEDGGTTWIEGNDGMARVPVFEIRGYEWRPWEGMVMYVGTHGRGYFRSSTLLTSTKNLKDNTTLKLNIYPNPTKGNATLTVDSKVSEKANLTVINLQGQVVLQKVLMLISGSNQIEINFGDLPKGYYFTSVRGSATQGTVKVCVQ